MPIGQAAETVQSLDLSLVISVVALVLSVLSPVFSAFIGGMFHLKEEKLKLNAEIERRNHEFYEQHRAEVIERYINAVGCVAQNNKLENRQEFGVSMGEIYLYVDESMWGTLDGITEKINQQKFSSLTEDITKLCKDLSTTNVRLKTISSSSAPDSISTKST